MSRRSTTLKRGRPHPPRENPDAPGCCLDCGRPLAARNNDMHIDEYPPVDPAVRTEEARRLGEHD